MLPIKDRTRAGFGINFSGLSTCNVKLRIPEHQTILRAEAYGVLTALMMVQSNFDLRSIAIENLWYTN